MNQYETKRVKYLAGINEHVLPESTPPDREMIYIDISSVGRGRLVSEPETITFATAPSRARRLVNNGDTIVSTVRTYLRAVLPIVDADPSLVVSTGFAVLTPKTEVDPRFIGWVAQSNTFVEEIVARSVGVSYPAINASEVGDIRIPSPNIARQQAIADFLDSETASIDALIDKKQRMIELFSERDSAERDALILAESGGSTCSLRWSLCESISDGPHETPKFVEDGVPFLSVDNIVNSRLNLEGCRYISAEDHDRYSRKLKPRYGDVLITKAASVGKVALVEDQLEFNIWSPIAVLRTDHRKLLPEFLWQYLRTETAQRELKLGSTSNTQQNISMRDLGSLQVPVIAIETQKALCDRLRKSQNDPRDRLSSSIRLLQERRQALITAAVTGQIEIPGVAA